MSTWLISYEENGSEGRTEVEWGEELDEKQAAVLLMRKLGTRQDIIQLSGSNNGATIALLERCGILIKSIQRTDY